MAFGTGGGELRSEINITPLVDVVLVLLIIFMVATPMMQMGLEVEVPPKVEATAPPPQPEATQLVVTVRTDGLYLNDARVENLPALGKALETQLKERAEPQRVVFVNSDDTVTFDTAVAAMDAATKAGAVKVGLLTDAPRTADER
ncbi:MAG TPA: biopolymer transporter ExbD [Thermoanaerobaculia bacterium]|jgi:biopolymer transport protein ExbD